MQLKFYAKNIGFTVDRTFIRGGEMQWTSAKGANVSFPMAINRGLEYIISSVSSIYWTLLNVIIFQGVLWFLSQ